MRGTDTMAYLDRGTVLASKSKGMADRNKERAILATVCPVVEHKHLAIVILRLLLRMASGKQHDMGSHGTSVIMVSA